MNERSVSTPEMILFDSGGTLCIDAEIDQLRAVKEIMPHIVKNPRCVGAEELNEALCEAHREILPARKAGFEVSIWTMMRIACGRCGVELSLDEQSFERVFRIALTPVEMLPHIDELLNFLNSAGIRTGVISNSRFSGVSLQERLDRLLPYNRFEFILFSCDYVLCKPKPALFEIALSKAGLEADRVWYCGDSMEADVVGARAAGIFPVHYDRGGGTSPKTGPDCLRISDWRDLIAVLQN